MNCQCDEICVSAGDCCLDYFPQCRNISDVTEIASVIRDALSATSHLDNRPVPPDLAYLVKNHSECLEVNGKYFTVVTSCPAEFSDARVKVQCESANMTSPVSHTQEPALVFKNRLCAECHKVRGYEAREWAARLQCSGLDLPPSLQDVKQAYRQGRCRTVHVPPEGADSPRSCSPPASHPCMTMEIPGPRPLASDRFCAEEDALLCGTYRLPLFACTNQTQLLSGADVLPNGTNGGERLPRRGSVESPKPCEEPLELFAEFLNPHCLKCATGYMPEEIVDTACSCRSAESGNWNEGSLIPPNILALFDITEDGSGVVINGQLVTWPGFFCQEDEVYDYVSKVCRAIVCSAGYVLVDRECVRGDPVVDGGSQLLPGGTGLISLHLWLAEGASCRSLSAGENEERSLQPESDMLSEVWNGLQGDRDSLVKEDSLRDSLTELRLASKLSCSADGHKLSIFINVSSEMNFTEAYKMSLGQLESRDPGMVEMLVNATLSNTERFQSVTSVCPDGSPPLVENDANVTENGGKLFVVWTKHGFRQLYPLENVPFIVTVSYEKTGKSQAEEEEGEDEDECGGRGDSCGGEGTQPECGWENTPDSCEEIVEAEITRRKTPLHEEDEEAKEEEPTEHARVHKIVRAVLCQQFVSNASLSCPKIVYPRNRTRLDNETLVVLDTDLTFSPDRYEFRGEDVLVCSPFENLNEVWSKLDLFDFTRLQRYVLLALTAVSILSLLLVLFLYLLLPELRTLPGRIICCLVASMLVGHVTLIVDVPSKMACHFIAAMSHFFWLASFAWMSAMAFHMANTFFLPAANQKTRQEADRSFRNYSLVCWGLPLAVVVTCLALDAFPSVAARVDYGGRVCGWMGEAKAVIFSFFLPVALSLLLNLLAFLAAVLGIERTSRASRVASSRRSEGQRFLVYVKMSAALGFAWGLGLLAAFLRLHWLQWLVVVLNSLQGTFIALAFLANQRVLRMLRRRLSGRARMKKSEECGSRPERVQTQSVSLSTSATGSPNRY